MKRLEAGDGRVSEQLKKLIIIVWVETRDKGIARSIEGREDYT